MQETLSSLTAAQNGSAPRCSLHERSSFTHGLPRRCGVGAQVGVPQLQRRRACDRLLERPDLIDGGRVVNGAAARLARDIGVRIREQMAVLHRHPTLWSGAVRRPIGRYGMRRRARACGITIWLQN
jgi:hypothetical protein